LALLLLCIKVVADANLCSNVPHLAPRPSSSMLETALFFIAGYKRKKLKVIKSSAFSDIQ
jgi:hypothetical protein